MDIDTLWEISNSAAQNVRKQLEQTASAVKERLTPAFIVRMRNKKIHEAAIDTSEL